MKKRDKIFFAIYTIIVIVFLICDLTFLNLTFKEDLLTCFTFLLIFNSYEWINKRL